MKAKRFGDAGWLFRVRLRWTAWGLAVWLGVAAIGIGTSGFGAEPGARGHVPELARYLDHVEILGPTVHGRLAVYPVRLHDGTELRGQWLTLDRAVSQGVLLVTEKGAGGSVPVVTVENRSRSGYVFIMAGEVISGGKQTRTVRGDVVVAPGQRIDLSVFCVEAHRWRGEKSFAGAEALVPQSIRKELRKGADQRRVWSEVARNNRALGAENATGSLERALKAGPVREKLAKVRRSIAPTMPDRTVGYLFVAGGRGVGADFFGRARLASALLPKLLDSYAVDFVLQSGDRARRPEKLTNDAAIRLFKRILAAGSERAETPGSGAGIRTRAAGLLGDGVSFGEAVVHYGVQIQDRIVPRPRPIPMPRRQMRNDVP